MTAGQERGIYVKTILETRKYAVSGSGSYGKLSEKR